MPRCLPLLSLLLMPALAQQQACVKPSPSSDEDAVSLLQLSPVTNRAQGWHTVNTSSSSSIQRQQQIADILGEAGGPLCKVKMSKMADTGAFQFYRGSAQIYYMDMGQNGAVRESKFFNGTNCLTWLQGDMHGQNMGAFDDGRGGKKTHYDMNDFDESWVASYLFDVKRMAASIVLLATEKNHTTKEAGALVDKFSKAYLKRLRKEAQRKKPAKQYTKKKAHGLLKQFLKDAEKKNSRKEMLDKYSDVVGGKRVFRTSKYCNSSQCSEDGFNEDVEWINDDLTKKLTEAIKTYAESHLLDPEFFKDEDDDWFKVEAIAKRVNAGTGSLGTPRFYAIIQGEDGKDDNAGRILDIKLQSPHPSIYSYLSKYERDNVEENTLNGAHRVVLAQQELLHHADPHLGWLDLNYDRVGKKYQGVYSVRERSPYKESFKDDEIENFDHFENQVEQYGTVMARAHSRPYHQNSPVVEKDFAKGVVARVDEMGENDFATEMREFGLGYANQVFNDFGYFRSLRDNGKWKDICI